MFCASETHDLLVEGVPSPAKKGTPIDVDGAGTAAFVFKTVADPFAGRINVMKVVSGKVSSTKGASGTVDQEQLDQAISAWI